MWASLLAILSSVGQIVLAVMRQLSDRDQRRIGEQDSAIKGFEEGKKNAEQRTKKEVEVGKLGPDDLDKRLDPWMRD